MSTILVTGGAGYIGSHTTLCLLNSGFEVIILDNLSYGHKELVDRVLTVELVIGDTNDPQVLDQIFTTHTISAVMHFASYIVVGESVQNPSKYYHNNLSGTLQLLSAMVKHHIPYFIFSSTAAVYGFPQQIPIPETHPQQPINPYGKSKLMIEQILEDYDRAYGLRYVSFRYFNAAGADPHTRLGEDHHPETHLIPLALLTAMGKRKHITVFGTDYPTPDGTCIRDYIHVCDLATAHVLGLKYLLAGNSSNVFNLGNGQGFSVQEVLDTVQLVTGKQLPIVYGARRAGDPPILVGSSAKARTILNWHTQYPDLTTIITHAWQWHQHRHGSLEEIWKI